VVEAWGIEPCATSAHPNDDGAEARSGPEGAAQNDTETREVRVDVDPMLAGASGEDGEMKTWTVHGTVTISVYTEVEAETAEEARAIAEERDCDTPHHSYYGVESEMWVADELDGTPDVTGASER